MLRSGGIVQPFLAAVVERWHNQVHSDSFLSIGQSSTGKRSHNIIYFYYWLAYCWLCDDEDEFKIQNFKKKFSLHHFVVYTTLIRHTFVLYMALHCPIIVNRGDWLWKPAHIKGPAFCFAFEVELHHHVTLTVHTASVHSKTIWRTRTICFSLETILTLF